MISDNIKSVTQRISKCCERSGRPEGSVRLVCVTKSVDAEQALDAIRCGAIDLGENRVQQLVSKYNIIGDKAVWHLIGHLQTNKVKDAVRVSSLIHSLDSLRLAKFIDREAVSIGKVQEVLVEVNTSGESSKFGLKPDDVPSFIEEVSSYKNIKVKGLMTMAPEADDPERSRPYFKRLRELRDALSCQLPPPGLRLEAGQAVASFRVLSMGMSNDFEVAIEEGADIVRVGRAIFDENRL